MKAMNTQWENAIVNLFQQTCWNRFWVLPDAVTHSEHEQSIRCDIWPRSVERSIDPSIQLTIWNINECNSVNVYILLIIIQLMKVLVYSGAHFKHVQVIRGDNKPGIGREI
jgi:hypothetical protein